MRITALVLAALLAGCVTGTPVQVADIKVASPQTVAACQYLDTVYGTSAMYGVFAEKGIENARRSAFDKSQQLRATHIVWEPVSQGHGSSSVAARAYRCAA